MDTTSRPLSEFKRFYAMAQDERERWRRRRANGRSDELAALQTRILDAIDRAEAVTETHADRVWDGFVGRLLAVYADALFSNPADQAVTTVAEPTTRDDPGSLTAWNTSPLEYQLFGTADGATMVRDLVRRLRTSAAGSEREAFSRMLLIAVSLWPEGGANGDLTVDTKSSLLEELSKLSGDAASSAAPPPAGIAATDYRSLARLPRTRPWVIAGILALVCAAILSSVLWYEGAQPLRSELAASDPSSEARR